MSQNLADLVERAQEEWYNRFMAGPRRVSWDELPPQIGDPAPDYELEDATGARRHLSEFWSDGPSLLIFLRHFGCAYSKERSLQVVDGFPTFEEAGATTAVVSEAEPERAAAYAEEYGIECPILCDPDAGVHETYGLLDFTTPEVWYSLPTETYEWYRSGSEESAEAFDENERVDGRPKVDNPWRQPGEFVIDDDGVLRLTYRYQYGQDFPDRRVLTTAIREAQRSSLQQL